MNYANLKKSENFQQNAHLRTAVSLQPGKSPLSVAYNNGNFLLIFERDPSYYFAGLSLKIQ